MNLARQDGAGPWLAVRKFELLYRHWGAMEGFGAMSSRIMLMMLLFTEHQACAFFFHTNLILSSTGMYIGRNTKPQRV